MFDKAHGESIQYGISVMFSSSVCIVPEMSSDSLQLQGYVAGHKNRWSMLDTSSELSGAATGYLSYMSTSHMFHLIT